MKAKLVRRTPAVERQPLGQIMFGSWVRAEGGHVGVVFRENSRLQRGVHYLFTAQGGAYSAIVDEIDQDTMFEVLSNVEVHL